MAAAVRIEGLRKVFSGAGTREPRPVLDGVDLEIREGELLSVIGPSGCGKTTLLHLVLGLEAPTGGRVEADRARMAAVFQRPLLLPWRTALANVCFSAECRGERAADTRARARRLLARVGLAGAEGLYPHELSVGMAQRVGLARALLVRPRILLMDEPFASLDVDSRGALQDELLSLRDELGLTVLFVSHQLEEVVYLSDRVAFLSPGPAKVRRLVEVALPRPRNRGREGRLAFAAQVEALAEAFPEPPAAGSAPAPL